MSSITFDGVTKRYGDVTAVDSLSLHIDDGEFMVLLGPSGCGKSTALRMIAGFEEITEGALHVGGALVNGLEPAKRDISMVFQSYALYPHMTVARNIESPLVVRQYHADGDDRPARKLTKTERTERVHHAATILGLDPYLDRKPKALSGGQRQRVALARAIVGQPKAYLMDEPLSNLDAKLRAETRRELVDLHERVAGTFVYVTHDQVEAMTMADRIAVMSMGQLQQVGTPEQVYETPQNLFVARFIGTPPMNTIPGKVSPDTSGVDVGDSRFPLPAAMQTRVEAGREVIVGARPEHLIVAEVGATGAIGARVRSVEWLGHERLIYCDIGDHPVLVRQIGVDPHDEGSTIPVTIDPGHVHLFDPDTGDRLP